MIPELDIHWFWAKRQVLEKNKKGVEKLVWRRVPRVCFNPPGASGFVLCGKSESVQRLCPNIDHCTCPECLAIWTGRMARAMFGE